MPFLPWEHSLPVFVLSEALMTCWWSPVAALEEEEPATQTDPPAWDDVGGDYVIGKSACIFLLHDAQW